MSSALRVESSSGNLDVEYTTVFLKLFEGFIHFINFIVMVTFSTSSGSFAAPLFVANRRTPQVYCELCASGASYCSLLCKRFVG